MSLDHFLNFDQVKSINVFFTGHAFGVAPKASLPNTRSQRTFPIFSSRSLTILGFIFRSMIHFELILHMVQGMDPLHMDIKLSQPHFC